VFVSCFVSPHYGGGIGRHTAETVSGLSRRAGIQVELLVSGRDIDRKPGFRAQFPGVAVRRLPFSNLMLERLWKSVGWPRVDGYASPDTDVIYAPAHARLPSVRHPTVITVHDIQAFETDLPWSNTVEHRRFARKWRYWLPKALAESARVLTDTEFSKRRLVELAGADPSRIGVVGCGASEIFFAAGEQPVATREDSIIVVGGIRTKKGAADTLAVARRLAATGSSLRIDVVGNNDPEWLDACRTLPNVRLLGVLPDEQLATLLAASCGLLFLSPYEGFGLPAVEAMAAGTPAVVANAASLPEIVGDAGVVVDPADTERIVYILGRLQDDAAYRQSLVERGRVHARTFTWNACVDRLVGELEKVVAR
jgi:glycosyltransferase involved in cell wall biosynthesis